jgi:hypothetical protein
VLGLPAIHGSECDAETCDEGFAALGAQKNLTGGNQPMSDTRDYEESQMPTGAIGGMPQENAVTLEVIQSPMRMSADISAIAAAFCEAQAKFQAAAKASENEAYKRGNRVSRYADLAAVIEAALPALNEAGIGVLQPARLSGTDVIVITRLQHKSGQFFETELTMPSPGRQGFTAQAVGSAITYARRYSLQALICLAAEDDDGNAASGVGSQKAADAVAAAKTAELKEKVKNQKEAQGKPSGVTPAVFYVFYKESNTFGLRVPEELKHAAWPLVQRFWDGGTKAFVVPADNLDDLKYELEQAKIPFHPLKAA